MAETGRSTAAAGSGLSCWFGFWLQLLVLGLLALTGAGFAGLGGRPGDYATGMMLSLTAVVLAFLRLKHHLDGGAAGWGGFILVSDANNLTLAIPLLAILGLLGLVAASAWPYGSRHAAGIALFVVSLILIFLDIKRVFDNIDAGGD